MSSEYIQFLSEMSGKRVAVLGMGISNVPLIRLLLNAGAEVLICDKKEASRVDEEIVKEFENSGAELRFGADYLKDLDRELIFKTPGMRSDIPELETARKKGAVITSEMEVFFSVCPCRIIGVTGSDGKTTTTTIIYELLRKQGYRCHIGGNIGMPLLNQTDKITPQDIVVLELSSFQLSDMTKSPQTAVITNIAPNHLDVHKSMEEYIEAKTKIYKNQTAEGRLVLNWDNDITKNLSCDSQGRVTFFSKKEKLENGVYLWDNAVYLAENKSITKILDRRDIKLPGLHNVENYMAAIAATEDMVKPEIIRKVAREFGGVEHRMEFVREYNGVSYYNDSIASSPTRTIAGLHAFDKSVILIAGGYDKKIPFDVLGPEVVDHVKKLILVGVTSMKIKEAVERAPGFNKVKLPIFMCQTFEEAVETAYKQSNSGDIVTLSPACASFDLFENFAVRGNRFKKLVNAL